jgi:hypothetical protein
MQKADNRRSSCCSASQRSVAQSLRGSSLRVLFVLCLNCDVLAVCWALVGVEVSGIGRNYVLVGSVASAIPGFSVVEG